MDHNGHLFYKASGAFRWHWAHPSERDRSQAPWNRSFVCGWKFRNYYLIDKKQLEDIVTDTTPICEKCRMGYLLYLVEI